MVSMLTLVFSERTPMISREAMFMLDRGHA
jgi:hypothetical protein